jgi:hypothetical protein
MDASLGIWKLIGRERENTNATTGLLSIDKANGGTYWILHIFINWMLFSFWSPFWRMFTKCCYDMTCEQFFGNFIEQFLFWSFLDWTCH